MRQSDESLAKLLCTLFSGVSVKQHNKRILLAAFNNNNKSEIAICFRENETGSTIFCTIIVISYASLVKWTNNTTMWLIRNANFTALIYVGMYVFICIALHIGRVSVYQQDSIGIHRCLFTTNHSQSKFYLRSKLSPFAVSHTSPDNLSVQIVLGFPIIH